MHLFAEADLILLHLRTLTHEVKSLKAAILSGALAQNKTSDGISEVGFLDKYQEKFPMESKPEFESFNDRLNDRNFKQNFVSIHVLAQNMLIYNCMDSLYTYN